MLWLAGGILAFTSLGFAAAIIASQIMAIVQGTPVQAALEERCQQSWYRIESWLGYHPLNQGLWHAMVNFPAMPPEAARKQRVLRAIVALQMIVLAIGLVGLLATTAIR